MFCFSWCLSRSTFLCLRKRKCCCFLIAMQRYNAFPGSAIADVDRNVYRDVDSDTFRSSADVHPQGVHGLFLHHDEVALHEVELLNALALPASVGQKVGIARLHHMQQFASSPHDL